MVSAINFIGNLQLMVVHKNNVQPLSRDKQPIKNNEKISPLLRLAFPMALNGVIQVSMPVVKTVFLAQLSIDALAAGAIVGTLYALILYFLLGILSSISIFVAREYGAHHFKTIPLILRDGFLFGLVLIIFCFLIFQSIPQFLSLIIKNIRLHDLVSSYLNALVTGVPAHIFFFILIEFYLGIGQARFILKISIVYAFFNILASYCLIFGKFGMPFLGIAGAGWATSITNWLTLFFLVTYISKKYFVFVLFGLLSKSKPKFLMEIIRIGIPLSGIYGIEAVTFFVTNVFMGKISIITLAANQITLQFLSMTLAIIFSISRAITVRIGHLIGSRRHELIQRVVLTGWFLNVGLAIAISLLFWYWPIVLISFDLTMNQQNKPLIDLASKFLLISGVFLIIDAARVTLIGILQSYKVTFYPMIISMFCFWMVALPLGYILAFPLNNKGVGLWSSLIIGNLLAVVLLLPLTIMTLKTNSYEERVQPGQSY
ncbi:TPA: MATE family efflux transporter [Legionella pneumophila]|nr:MATE family efflux transporter [Legionella pneumophila]